MDQRARFIFDLRSCRYTMTELCERYGVSRKTGYKWAERYVDGGIESLQDRSRAPHHSPQRTPEPLREALIEARQAHPTWGPKKLLRILSNRHPTWPWPALSTAGEILRQAGLVAPRRRRRRRPQPPTQPLKTAPTRPNQLWTADFKGEFRTGDHRYCYPLTIADGCSRFLLACEGQSSTSIEQTRPGFERTFETYGLPDGILTDNGPPFGSHGLLRLSKLSVWFAKLGIELYRIQPGHPEQNGSHERMHRTLKRETARPPAADLQSQQARFDAFVQEYNDERPHEALDQECPQSLYQASLRPYPQQVPEVDYPGHFEVRRVRPNGEVKWQGQRHFLSEALAGERVGFEEVDDGIWSVVFATILLARYDERERLIS
ncbi:MAG: IS481 family transposase [Acidobacteria bacterium]|nr:IS481 family transposase [Acidobacteriota bacterium]